jgi:hypothetical protein
VKPKRSKQSKDSRANAKEDSSPRVCEESAVFAKREEHESRAEEPNSWLQGESRLAALARSWGKPLELPRSAPDDPRLDYLLKKYWHHRE